MNILDPVVQYIFAGFCIVLVFHLFWVNRRLFKERGNDFRHIKKVLEGLPCKTHTEKLRQQEKNLNSLLKKEDKS